VEFVDVTIMVNFFLADDLKFRLNGLKDISFHFLEVFGEEITVPDKII
jgi:hypothetical protein